jgi:hypothetical protein
MAKAGSHGMHVKAWSPWQFDAAVSPSLADVACCFFGWVLLGGFNKFI